MDVKPGYKQTEVGVIPEDWEVVRLGCHTDITKLAGFEYSKHFNSYKDGGDIIVIRGTNIADNSLNLSDVRTIPQSTSDKLPRSKLKEGDLVFAYVGTIGPVFLIDKDNQYHLGPNTARITCKDGLDPRFLFCYFLSDLIRKEITERISTGAQPSLSMTKIRDFRISKPTKAEQKAIAEALSDADAPIESLEQLLVKKRQLKQCAMQELLTGKKRLPGFIGEWTVKRLGDLAELYQPETIGQSVFTHDGYPVYGANGVIGTYARYNHLTSQITISCRGNCGTVNRTEPRSWITGNAMVVNLDKNKSVDLDFMFHLLKSLDFSALVTGSGQPQIVRGPLADFEVSLPTERREQTAIAEVLSDMDAELAVLTQRRAKLHVLKQGMMQELLTGRIRLA